MVVRSLGAADIALADEVGELLARSLAADGIIRFLFGDDTPNLAPGFFACLARARCRMEMPFLAAVEESIIVAAGMGYAPDPPEWPASSREEWQAFLSLAGSGVEERIEHYHTLSQVLAPRELHHYLGVLGVEPGRQRRGIGSGVLEAFLDLARSDKRSRGVYLETANPAAYRFYVSRGFQVAGQAPLGNSEMVAMFWPWPQGR